MKTAPLAGLIISITIPTLILILFLPCILKCFRARKKQSDEDRDLEKDQDLEMSRGVATLPHSPFTISSPTASGASTPELMSPVEAKRCNEMIGQIVGSNPSASSPSMLSTRPNAGSSEQVQTQAHRMPHEAYRHDGPARRNQIHNGPLQQNREQEQKGPDNVHWREVLESREDLTHTEKLILASKHKLTHTPAPVRPASSSTTSFSYSSSDEEPTHLPPTDRTPTPFPTTTSPYPHPSPLAQHPTRLTTSDHASARSPRTHGLHYTQRVLSMSSSRSSPVSSRQSRPRAGGSFAQRVARSEISAGIGRERDGTTRQRKTLAERRGQMIGGLEREVGIGCRIMGGEGKWEGMR